MKKISTLLLALVAMAATAGAQDYALEVCNVQVTDANKSDIAAAVNAVYPGAVSGKIAYDSNSGKLVLDNVKVNSETITQLIDINKNAVPRKKYTIELVGENSFVSTHGNAVGINVCGEASDMGTEVTITGSGSLSIDVSNGFTAIQVRISTFTIDATTVHAKSQRGIEGNVGELVIKNAYVSASKIFGFNKITLTDCEIVEPAGAIIVNNGGVFDICVNDYYAENVVIKPTSGASIGSITSDDNADNRWHSLDGKRLNGEPKQRGIYIQKGKKVKR